MHHTQLDYLRRRIEEEEAAAAASSSLEVRQVHAELALHYLAQLKQLKRRALAAAA